MTMTDRKQELASLKKRFSGEMADQWWIFAVFWLIGTVAAAGYAYISEDLSNAVWCLVVSSMMYAIATTQRAKQQYIGPMIDVLIDMDEDSKD
jgi:hypothetical protein